MRFAFAAATCAVCSATFADVSLEQAAASKPLVFEAASVKPATAPDGVTVTGDKMMVRKGSGIPIPRNSGGPGSSDPGRIHYPLISLKALLKRAWDGYADIRGPGWIEEQLVSVDATMPTNTTQEQFREMLRNLMIERFSLRYHTESREMGGYALVRAKGGLKIRESADQSGAAAGPPERRPTQRDADGFMVLPARAGSWCAQMTTAEAHARMICQQKTMKEFAAELGQQVNATVTDATGLKARFDFTVTYGGGMGRGGALAEPPPDAAEPLPDLFNALQSQLGLRLEPKKISPEILVIDHMEKTPATN